MLKSILVSLIVVGAAQAQGLSLLDVKAPTVPPVAVQLEVAYHLLRHAYAYGEAAERTRANDVFVAARALSLDGVRLYWPDVHATTVTDVPDVSRTLGLLPPALLSARGLTAPRSEPRTAKEPPLAQVDRAFAPLPGMITEAKELIAKGDAAAFKALSRNFTARFDAYVVLAAERIRADQAIADEVFRADVAAACAGQSEEALRAMNLGPLTMQMAAGPR